MKGACFESIGRIACSQVYCVVPFGTDRKRNEGRTSGLSEMGCIWQRMEVTEHMVQDTPPEYGMSAQNEHEQGAGL